MFIVLQITKGNIDLQNKKDLTTVFPMFRGASLFILYVWLLAWNVHGWNRFNVNYRLIFKFNHHYSRTEQILGRAAAFSLIFLLMLLLYLAIRLDFLGSFLKDNDISSYTPLIVWVCFFGYVFFPSNRLFNGKGRQYFYRLMRACLFSMFYKMEFRIAWATDQLVSFVGPLKDLSYTLCYYGSDFTLESAVDHCADDHRIVQGFIIAFIPLFFRMC
jgi:hypothetical protein